MIRLTRTNGRYRGIENSIVFTPIINTFVQIENMNYKHFFAFLCVFATISASGQYRFSEYISTYVPNNSVEIALRLNKRYKENLNLRNTIVANANDLLKYELHWSEENKVKSVLSTIESWDNRGDYENAGEAFSSLYLKLYPLCQKYHPNIDYVICSDLIDYLNTDAVFFKGFTFESSCLSEVYFYEFQSAYFAEVYFKNDYASLDNLTKERGYVYCGLSLSEVEEFVADGAESYGEKFHRIIKQHRCVCD